MPQTNLEIPGVSAPASRGWARILPDMYRLLALSLAAVLIAPACDDESDSSADEKAKADVEWPDKPADGSDMVLEVLSHTADSAKVRVFNFADKGVAELHVRQHFLDEAGKELDTFPFSQIGSVVEAKGTAEIETVMMGVPEGMKKVEISIKTIVYAGGGEWKAKAQ